MLATSLTHTVIGPNTRNGFIAPMNLVGYLNKNSSDLINSFFVISDGSRISQGRQPHRTVHTPIICKHFLPKLHENESAIGKSTKGRIHGFSGRYQPQSKGWSTYYLAKMSR